MYYLPSVKVSVVHIALLRLLYTCKYHSFIILGSWCIPGIFLYTYADNKDRPHWRFPSIATWLVATQGQPIGSLMIFIIEITYHAHVNPCK